jgi:hybrid cluster-associated redox disulfide protein
MTTNSHGTRRTFEADMTVGAALAQHPSARWVFAAYHIGGCHGCAKVDDETLAEVADGYKLPLDRLLADLNALQ